MLKITTLTIGQLQTNCYLAVCSETNQAVIVDPADEGTYVTEVINRLQIRPIALLATHGHFDHILASLELKLAYNIPFSIHPNDEFLLKQMQSSAKHWLGINTDPPAPVDTFLTESEPIYIGNQTLQIIHTPGHTPGSTSLYSKQSNILFTGDTLFADGGVGRTDFRYSSSIQLQKSLTKLFTFPKETIIYPGHGRSSTLGEEASRHKS